MKILLEMQGVQCQSRHRGIGRYTLELSRAFATLASPQHDVHFAFNSVFGNVTDPVISTLLPHADRDHRMVFTSLHDVAAQNIGDRRRRLAAEQVVRHALAQASADVVWYSSMIEGYVDDAVIPKPPIPGALSVATLYDLIPLHDPDAYLGHPRVRSWYDTQIEALAQCDLFLAISDWVRDDAIARLGLSPERVVNIGAGVDPRFVPATDDPATSVRLRSELGIKRPYVLYNGGFDPRKNVKSLIHAYAALPAEIRNRHQLVIVGRTAAEQLAQLKAAARKARLGDSEVVFTDFVTDEVLIRLYSECALFVFPSVMEGFGLPPLEAMACGAPVIASNASSLAEIVGDPDAMFDPRSREAITRRMREVLEQPALADTLRQNGKRQATKYSWSAVAQRALHAIEQLPRKQHANPTAQSLSRLCCVHACMPPAWLDGLSAHYEVDRVDLAPYIGHAPRDLADRLGKADRILYIGGQDQLESLAQWMHIWPGVLLGMGSWNACHPAPSTPADAHATYLSQGYAGLLGETLCVLACAAVDGCLGLLLSEAMPPNVTGPDETRKVAVLRSSNEAANCRHHLEDWYATSQLPVEARLLDILAQTFATSSNEDVLTQVSDSIVAARPAGKIRQWLVDVTQIAQDDIGTGVQRVVRSILTQWLRRPPEHIRIEPVAFVDGSYRYARRFALGLLGLPGNLLSDGFVAMNAGDTYVALDWCPHALPASEPLLRDWHRRGVEMHFIVHDLLPITLPASFHPFARDLFTNWLRLACGVADRLHCVSGATASELERWMKNSGPAYQFNRPPSIYNFTLGVDPAPVNNIPRVLPTPLAQAVDHRATLLMVGTLEPRKAHAFALDAIERLWATGHDVNLLIVGRHGWMMEHFVKRLEAHPERNRRLFWIDDADDSLLNASYRAATALLATSLGEGFGLPLIEAARHGLPVIARNLPVFREIMGEYPCYFESTDPHELAQVIAGWLGSRPQPGPHRPWTRWAESAAALAAAIQGEMSTHGVQTTV
ncbi:glycosyltransferase family 1 protein [Dyella sp. A6]|uniref:glycosyltransferase family 4 protein n=1 Tax=Dyella aluminiiresistens TaxID=3069105 RepID=UPI002E7A7860|nr:glycosyltransferase family 1 protein [Dyella sp. A6]